MLLLLLMAPVLSACAHDLMTQAVSDYCRIAQPIRYNSKLDSPKTVAAIEAHNSQYVCVCEDDCPKGK
jgi:hypothetical protein